MAILLLISLVHLPKDVIRRRPRAEERKRSAILGYCSIFGINMKGLYIIAFCALIALSLMTLAEAEEVTKRGWLADKWNDFSDRVNKNIEEADEAVSDFLGRLRHYREMAG
ncbi:hypothetical protein PoB_002631000 [Plakobranchus ocellatus]|uniref:Uncharacterized protein n=1 Tax=Plakobranchus ocellatus TaxID=259542 RepID=A0AAV3ZYT3_9GAST|nr:hypothetical protein PoB_002631000 [Plakobranchus ocellatus]